MSATSTDRRLMEIAIEEMRKSRSEHHDKTDPTVGAVLVSKEGKEIAKLGRAALRVGDHAEYQIIERICKGQDLEGTTLYVTLEPCAERNPPKKPCAEWIWRARIGRVVIGIIDPDSTVNGRGIAILEGNGVEIDFFDKDLKKVIREENKAFIQQCKQRKNSSTASPPDYQGVSGDEERVVNEATLNDLSHDVIREYVAALKLSFRVPSPKVWEYMKRGGFLADARGKANLIPTVAGLVFFGKSPHHVLHQCKIKAYRLRGSPDGGAVFEELVHGNGQVDISGPLPRMVQEVERFFIKHVAKVPQIEGMKRKDVPEYPLDVIREAVVNALVHRDYRAGAYVDFKMYPDRIVVKSPGHAPPPITLQQIRSYTAPSIRRNQRIATAAASLGLMEEGATGLAKMRDKLKIHGLRDPQFDYEPGFFVVTLFGRELSPISFRLTAEIRAQLTERQQALLILIQEQGRVTSAKCTEHFDISRETATQDFKKLMDLDLVQRKGIGRSIYYVLKGI